MADDRRAAQALEDAELDFVRRRAPPAGRSRARNWRRLRRAGRRSGRRAGGRGVFAQPADVVRGLGIVLAPADQRLHLGVELWMPISNCSAPGGKRAIIPSALPAGGPAPARSGRRPGLGSASSLSRKNCMIFRLVLTFRLKVRSTNLNRRAPRAMQRFAAPPGRLERERPGGLVERGQAELALERTAARGLHVERRWAMSSSVYRA